MGSWLASLAPWLGNQALTPTFGRIESWLARGGLAILGFGIWTSVDLMKNAGFGFVTFAFIMHLVRMSAKRNARKAAISD